MVSNAELFSQKLLNDRISWTKIQNNIKTWLPLSIKRKESFFQSFLLNHQYFGHILQDLNHLTNTLNRNYRVGLLFQLVSLICLTPFPLLSYEQNRFWSRILAATKKKEIVRCRKIRTYVRIIVFIFDISGKNRSIIYSYNHCLFTPIFVLLCNFLNSFFNKMHGHEVGSV